MATNIKKPTDIHLALAAITGALKAPKNKKNNFGNYNYRSCESILEAVKPLLGHLSLTMSDEMVAVGNRIYVKATVTLAISQLEGEYISVSAFAREAEIKKGMDDAQVTGSASSYARKYALCGMFCIDDNQDPDSMDNRNNNVAANPSQGEQVAKQQQQQAPAPAKKAPAKKAPAKKAATPKAEEPEKDLVEVAKEELDATVVNTEEKPSSYDADGTPQYEYDALIAEAESLIEEHGLEAGSVETACGFISKARTVSLYALDADEVKRFIAGVKKRIRDELDGKINPFESKLKSAGKGSDAPAAKEESEKEAA